MNEETRDDGKGSRDAMDKAMIDVLKSKSIEGRKGAIRYMIVRMLLTTKDKVDMLSKGCFESPEEAESTRTLYGTPLLMIAKIFAEDKLEKLVMLALDEMMEGLKPPTIGGSDVSQN